MTRGGKREGAGRKKGIKKIRHTIRLSIKWIKWLRKQDQYQGVLIERALKETYSKKKGEKDG